MKSVTHCNGESDFVLFESVFVFILFHLILGESEPDLGNIMLFSGQLPTGILFVRRMEGRILIQRNVCLFWQRFLTAKVECKIELKKMYMYS